MHPVMMVSEMTWTLYAEQLINELDMNVDQAKTSAKRSMETSLNDAGDQDDSDEPLRKKTKGLTLHENVNWYLCRRLNIEYTI